MHYGIFQIDDQHQSIFKELKEIPYLDFFKTSKEQLIKEIHNFQYYGLFFNDLSLNDLKGFYLDKSCHLHQKVNLIINKPSHPIAYYIRQDNDLSKCIQEILNYFQFDHWQRYHDKDRANIVLIGMPGCGKTTIGKEISHLLHKTFIDTDDKIIEKTHMSIPDLFKNYGEYGFRQIESSICNEVSKNKNAIISTGGGIIKNKNNIEVLKQNSLFIFIDRDLDKLIHHDPNRPLSNSKNAVAQLFNERYPIYKQYADLHIQNNTDLYSTIQAILKYICEYT